MIRHAFAHHAVAMTAACSLLRDPGGFVPLRLEPLRSLLRCLPCLKGTHAHTVIPNLVDCGRR